MYSLHQRLGHNTEMSKPVIPWGQSWPPRASLFRRDTNPHLVKGISGYTTSAWLSLLHLRNLLHPALAVLAPRGHHLRNLLHPALRDELNRCSDDLGLFQSEGTALVNSSTAQIKTLAVRK